MTTFIDVEADNPAQVLYVHDRPVLELGQARRLRRQRRDALVHRQPRGRKYLFYIGWNQGVTVPYRNAVGLAVSDDGGLTFERVFEGPIVDRTRCEPYFCASPFAHDRRRELEAVVRVATGFVVVDGKPEPVYQVKYAESRRRPRVDQRPTSPASSTGSRARPTRGPA